MIVSAAAFLALPLCAHAQIAKEYAIKAAMLYKFTLFVHWPEPVSERKFCVMGMDPFNSSLASIESQSNPNFTYKIERNVSLADAASCHVVFISNSEEGKLSKILAALKSSPVLTVGEMPDFAKKGGMIGFLNVDSKIKIEVNLAWAKAAGLRMDSNLLEVAMKVIQ